MCQREEKFGQPLKTGAMQQPTLAAVRDAMQRIRPYVHQTPVLTCEAINRMTGARLFFKCENFQKAGAFKSRGACNAVFKLGEDQRSAGVLTHSSGNHAAALARAAGLRNIPVHIVMPRTAPALKIAAVKEYGAQITFCEATQKDREETTERIRRETGAALIHPYDDYRIIAGQGTAALELIEQVSDLDAVIAPVGGGGLLSGTLITVKALLPQCRVFAAEPAAVDDAYHSWKEGKIFPPTNKPTMADGLRTGVGSLTFPIISQYVHEIVRTSEEEIAAALRILFERMKIVVEPSSAVALAPLLAGRLKLDGNRVGIILSGGNVDPTALAEIFGGADKHSA